jgi:hypothetical protein
MNTPWSRGIGTAFAMWMIGLAVPAWAQSDAEASLDVDDTSASRPATMPAVEIDPDMVIVRLGDRGTITQAEVEEQLRLVKPRNPYKFLPSLVLSMADEKLFGFYVEDHPDLVSEEEVDEAVEAVRKGRRARDIEQLKERLKQLNIDYDDFRHRQRLFVARAKLRQVGIQQWQNEEILKETYEANPDHFNGARVILKHILLAVPVYASPEQFRQVRERAEKMRDDIVAGRRTWSECVKESNCTTRLNDGQLGAVPRYRRLTEPLMAAAWNMKEGELQVVKTDLGYHIVELTGRTPGHRDFNDPHTTFALRELLHNRPYRAVIRQMREKYPVVGVNWPMVPPDLFPVPATAPASTRPATTTRPASIRPAARRPAPRTR